MEGKGGSDVGGEEALGASILIIYKLLFSNKVWVRGAWLLKKTQIFSNSAP